MHPARWTRGKEDKMGTELRFDLHALRAGELEVDESEPQYALAFTGYAYPNNEGETARRIVAFEARRLHRGSDGRWNPDDDETPEVTIAFENPGVVPENEFENSMKLDAMDAARFAFAILEAAGIEVSVNSEATGEKFITRETYTLEPLSMYNVTIPEEAPA
jgi:hypothetical protein